MKLMTAAGLGAATLALAALAPARGSASQESRGFELALRQARTALDQKDAARAREYLDRALERDPHNLKAWELVAEWARLAQDPDEEAYALHRGYDLAQAQGAERAELKRRWSELTRVDPLAERLRDLRESYVGKLTDLAERYEKDGRHHSAIAVHREVLALSPDRAESQAAIERIAAAPDPSLAEFAKPRDLFADISEEEIAAFDAEHADWKTRARLERENYVTLTDAGYKTMLIAAEAMEQMNAFYREFFRYGTAEDGRSVPRIELHIFRSRDEYLELGQGPPVEWSGGQFTGGAVETYVAGGDPTQMFGTLFHEAAHQFVSLATNAAGWLNEGLASFFEGSRILPNGTVEMNEPADHRLFPLAERMKKGWMSSWDDGYDPTDSDTSPTKAPTFRIIVANEYPWGPPWYAPTWGIVYFLYNYQDPVDGRFVYRAAFQDFIDRSGGRMGEGAVENFEETVLANPKPPIEGVERPEDASPLALPRTVEELDEVWKNWTLELQAERLGQSEGVRPYLDWARYAVADGDWKTAQEHFEKALLAEPESAEVRIEFARLLHEHLGASDRAAQLLREALVVLEGAQDFDQERVREAERLLAKADPHRRTLEDLHADLLEDVRALVRSYAEAGRPKMVMHLAWRFGLDLGDQELFDLYAEAARSSGKSLLQWRLAYNERDMEGWSASGGEPAFVPNGAVLEAGWSDFTPGDFGYQFLTLEELSSGDFSLEAEVQAARGKVAFAGLAFGRKGTADLHALLLFPGKADSPNGYLDLASFYGSAAPKTWRHVPVPYEERSSPTSSGRWYRLRIDVTGRFCDLWIDGQFQGTQDFGSRDVLRGGMGLVVGSGHARFRNVRFRTTHPRDPAARIEREVRLEQAGTAGRGGSYLGQVPPWPHIQRWVQGQRSGWDDVGPAPQLVVFWSRDQMEAIPLDGWMREMAERHADVGLEVLSVASPNDLEAIDDWLAEHPLPGAVGVDAREGEGIGESFELYGIDRFYLPRVLLLDVDGRVVWEGEPGFERAKPWTPGAFSFVDDPLEDLIARRKLREFRAWNASWTASGGRKALHEGRVGDVLPLLAGARDLDGTVSGDVLFAQRSLEALEASLNDLEGTCERVAQAGTEPALPVLIEWGRVLELEPDARARKKLKKCLGARSVKQWETTLEAAGRWLERAEPGQEEALTQRFLEKTRRLSGTFVSELRGAVEEAAGRGDWPAVRGLLEAAPRQPVLWLARELFGW